MNSPKTALQGAQGTEPTPVELNLTNMVIDNLDTYYQIPPNAKGVIYFYHGTGGSAGSSASQVETELFEKAALARGYGVVFLESTNRTSKQWTATTDPTMSPDIQHIERVRSYLQSVGLPAQLPEFGLGMSNGGGFVPYAGYYFKYRGVAIYCAAGYQAVFQKADYTIPTFFMVAEHDTVVTSNPAIISNANYLQGKSVPVLLETNYEEALKADRFTRISGITIDESNFIFESLKQARFIDGSGTFLKSPVTATSADIGNQFSQDEDRQIMDQLRAVYGEHQFTSEFTTVNLDFFDAY